ncbi:hypothetical protein WJX81_008377 [Elliptochloris bilobata]|uniref:RRM domain-containing protein n=1 Tax=Elliptochloris bilobata TaxID=381761 RepID=A0AAW1QMR8_9CHLO
MFPLPHKACMQTSIHRDSGGDLLTRMEGLQLNPRAKPFVLTPQDRSKPGGGNLRVGRPGLSGNMIGDVKQMEENVRRTVYICDIDQQVTEEQLAGAFQECGQVVDCRVCGDPNSAMRFAFIEFYNEDSVQKAMATMNGVRIGAYPLRVLPSKTAIVPVNNQFLPRTAEERELCGRTVYVANIDKKVDKQHVLAFFEKQCGPVSRIRLLGDHHHQTRIAFVEFHEAKHAKEALDCSGALLGSLPVRVSPSKAPVRDEPPVR